MALDVIELLKCALPGTAYGERKSALRVEPQQGETVILFRSDSAEFRQCTNVSSASKACDVMVFYHKHQKTVICFVELKGRDVEHGYDQLEATYQQFKQALGDSYKNIIWRGIVRTSSSPPKAPKKRHELDIQARANPDIGDILRK